MSLAALVQSHNSMAVFFKEAPWSETDITHEMAQKMFQRLDSNLSPESLFADGERSSVEAARLEKQYKAAIRELSAKGFRPSSPMYNYVV